MLRITVPAAELWDEQREEFIYTKEQTLTLEHSLVSLSKWESKWKKAFLSKAEKTTEQTIDYIRCMTITQNVDPEVYNRLTAANFEEVEAYIEEPMTATYFPEDPDAKVSREVVTAEVIYHWMISYNIPSEYQKWHLNRLLALIRVHNTKTQPPKKMSPQEIMRRNAALNAARKKKHNSTG